MEAGGVTTSPPPPPTSAVLQISLANLNPSFVHSMITYLLVLSCAISFTLRHLVDPYYPFLLLAFVLLLFFATLGTTCLSLTASASPPRKRNWYDAAPAGWLWMAWLLYGMIFGEQSETLPFFFMYIQGGVLVCVYGFSLLRKTMQKPGLLFGMVILVSVNLFAPFSDMMAPRLSTAFFLVKTSVFCLVYFTADHVVDKYVIFQIRRDDKVSQATGLQIKFLHSFWVLLAPLVFLPLALCEFAYAYVYLNSNVGLPTRRPPPQAPLQYPPTQMPLSRGVSPSPPPPPHRAPSPSSSYPPQNGYTPKPYNPPPSQQAPLPGAGNGTSHSGRPLVRPRLAAPSPTYPSTPPLPSLQAASQRPPLRSSASFQGNFPASETSLQKRQTMG